MNKYKCNFFGPMFDSPSCSLELGHCGFHLCGGTEVDENESRCEYANNHGIRCRKVKNHESKHWTPQ